MKNSITKLFRAAFFFALLTFASCQEEFEEIGGQEQETIEAGSTTANLIVNTSANDGSYDNIVDEASCFAIQFPYTVEIADVQITIDAVEDLRVIEEIFDEFDTDDDILEILFPITVTFADYSELVIENKEQLRELAADCIEGGEDDDIECIDFVYPITLFTFDINQQVTGEVQVNSDREMRRFFKEKDASDLVSIDYPVTLAKYDGTEVTVQTNAQLAMALETAKDECDEDDDDDYNDDDFDEERFLEYLTDCPWKLRDIRRLGVDQLGQYEGFTFEFEEEGVVTITGPYGNATAEGEWSYEFTANGLLVSLAFTNYTDFNATWLVYEIEEGKIKFYSDSDNRIVLKKFCEGDDDDDSSTDCNIEEVAEYLETCNWRVADASDEFEFEGTIDFSNRNIHAYYDTGAFGDEGNWEIVEGKLRFNALFDAVEPLSGDWEVVQCGPERIKLMNADNRYVVIEKDCEFEVPTLDGLLAQLTECAWIVEDFVNQGFENDRILGYELEFTTTGVVTLSNGIEVSEGTWEVGFNNAQQLALQMSIEGEPDLSYEWALVEAQDGNLYFKIEEFEYELELEKVCEANTTDSDVLEIRNIMMGGTWMVALFEYDETNNTVSYQEYDFSFSADNTVEVSVNNDPITTGLWRVIRDSDGDLKLYLNLGVEDPFDELTEDWDIGTVTVDRIELLDDKEDETAEILVFEKRI